MKSIPPDSESEWINFYGNKNSNATKKLDTHQKNIDHEMTRDADYFEGESQMITEESKQKLYDQKLKSMVEVIEIQEGDPIFKDLSFQEQINMIIDTEYSRLKSVKLKQLI